MRARMRMEVDGRFIAFGLLVGIGFVSGFALSAEVSPKIRPSDPPPLAKAGGGGSRGGGQLNGASGGGGGGGPVHGSGQATDTDIDEAEGAEGGGSAAARAGSADGSGTRAGPGAGAADAPCRSVDLLGAEAAAFLSGNTADGLADAKADPELLYFAPRGWIGRLRASSIEVKAWSRAEGSFCDPNLRPRAAPSCGVLHARRCVDEARRDGARIGDLLRPSGRWIPVVRGRASAFPAHLPFLDAPPSAAELTPRSDAPAGAPRGRAAFAAGTAYARAGGPGGPGAVVFYASDGRRLTFPRPSGEDLRRGFAVDVGWWTLARDVLCQGEGASGDDPSCFKPRPGKGGRLTLVSTADRPRIDLLAVAEPEPSALDDD